MYEAASQLFNDYIENVLVGQGWTVVRVHKNAFVLKGVDGIETFATCYVEQYLDQERYSVFIKFDWDKYAPIGTVAEIDGEYKIFELE